MYRHPHDGGGWALCVALLTRQALETAVTDFWTGRNIDMNRARGSSSLIALCHYVEDPALAREARHVWCALSEATHYGAYELAPTTGELRGWIETVTDVIARLPADSSASG